MLLSTGGGSAARCMVLDSPDQAFSNPGGEPTLHVLRRRWRIILVCTIGVAALAGLYSFTRTKEYSATAALLFRDPAFDQKLFGTSFLAPSADPQSRAATDLKLASLDNVADSVARSLGSTRRDVLHTVQVTRAAQSNIVNVTATTATPAYSSKLATAYAEKFIDIRRQADVDKITAARRRVEAQYASLGRDQRTDVGQALEQRIQQLTVLSALQTGNVELAQQAFAPSSPSHPKPVRNTIAGALLGLLLGVAAALGLSRVDRRIRNVSDVESTIGQPLLGLVPHVPALAGSDALPHRLDPATEEAIRAVRANLRYFRLDSDATRVMITSAASGDGKTTIAWCLAWVAARSGDSVLLIETDLRRRRLDRDLGSPGAHGLSTYLSGDASAEDVTRRIAVPDSAEGRTFDVISAGPLPPNPAELLESRRMFELLRDVSPAYNLVIVDTPPLTAVADAVPLAKLVDGVVIVSRLGASTHGALVRLRDLLGNLGANTLGVIVNGAPRSELYHYGYASEYAARADRVEGPVSS